MLETLSNSQNPTTALASQTTRLQDTRLRVATALGSAIASQTTSLRDYKTTSGYRLGVNYCFADNESTRLQDYKWLPPWAQLLLRRLRDYKTTSGYRLRLSYCFADYETTRLRVATSPLVDSLSGCLGEAKRNQFL